MKRTVLLVAVFVLMVTLPALVSAAGDDEAKALFESKCSLCHSLENATDITDTPEGWLSTVTRMREQNGCDITRQESDIIINYLAKFYGR
ncbi:hypothetical protein LCGC14_2764240 [marine sediment metagenome]|uniref:Quinohemoprotein amine dehydrogenase alpha subunit haem binding domain-containing protein n=1 Tax=marine sediment metagenome TaxID=412755 RepID=A0A0F8YXZ9_9ZZZZ